MGRPTLQQRVWDEPMNRIDIKDRLPDYRLDGRVVVITGGTKGLGFAIGRMFACFGAKVVIAGRNPTACENAAKAIRDAGGVAEGIPADVTKLSDIQVLIDGAKQIDGDINILVNCAGLAVTKPILEMDEEDYDRVMDTNLKGLYFGSAFAAQQMKESGHGGKIIQIASIGGLMGSNQLSVYGASKAAVLNLTKTMAIEWSRYGIDVTAICPGYVKTEINEKVFSNPDFLEKTLKSIPQRRLGTAEEVAAIALFLASDFSGMISGSAIVADMGATA